VVVERYARLITDRGIERMHQEDGCQVLGLPAGATYPRSTGPRVASVARIASLLVARAEAPMAELRRLLEQTIVNVALINTDAHAKNISIVHAGPRTVTLSPLYDVAATAWYLPTQTQVALPVGGTWRIHEVERRHLLAEARSWSMPETVARSIIDKTLDAVLAGMATADARYPDVPAGMRAAVDAQARRDHRQRLVIAASARTATWVLSVQRILVEPAPPTVQDR